MLAKFAAGLALFASVAFASEREPGPKPYLIAAIGDSLSAASVANLEGPAQDYVPAPGEADPADPEGGGMTDEELSERLLGIDYGVTNKKTFSWPTGKRIRSQRRLLEQWLKERGETRGLRAFNTSRPGKRASDTEFQAGEVVKAARSGHFSSVLLVTMMIGNNDACSNGHPAGTPDEEVKASLVAGFRKLSEIQQDEPIRVLVSALPRIADLGEERIRLARTRFGVSCEKLRNGIFDLCSPLVTWATEEEHQAKLAVVAAKNQAIFEAVMDARAMFPNLDVFYTDVIFDRRIQAAQLAIDCFHPSPQGQEDISLTLWKAQPWFRLGSVPEP